MHNGQALHFTLTDTRTTCPLIAVAKFSRIKHSSLPWWARKRLLPTQGRDWLNILHASMLHVKSKLPANTFEWITKWGSYFLLVSNVSSSLSSWPSRG